MVLRREVGVFGFACCCGGLDECFTQPRTALASLAVVLLTCTLVMTGAHACPGGEVAGGGEAGHGRANLREQVLGRAPSHTRNDIQSFKC